MRSQVIAAALKRVESVLRRRPAIALQDDSPAEARWEGGTHVVTSHSGGAQVVTDMPRELGGSGEHTTPGWLMRAGLASCAATQIAMEAAVRGIELTTLTVVARSRSDTRGMLGLSDVTGDAVTAAPQDVQLLVRIGAETGSPDRLKALVEDTQRCSPVTSALREPVPVSVHVEVVE
ncbi:MAG TPA: OsmC family protein [Steroidobacteraceae bacterium]|nr:OsmC family protein [Steroidobacteraceae bacterium]